MIIKEPGLSAILAFSLIFLWSAGNSPAAENIDSEQGMITKIIDHYVRINLGREHNIHDSDTLWVYRNSENHPRYIGLVRVFAVTSENCGAKIMYTSSGCAVEVLDMVCTRPESINLMLDREGDNLKFASGLVGKQVQEGMDKEAAAIMGRDKDHGRKRQMPSILLFTVGGVGVGVTAGFAAAAFYHDYKSKYTDDVANSNSHLQKYHDFRKARNIAAVSSAGILVFAIISHYVTD